MISVVPYPECIFITTITGILFQALHLCLFSAIYRAHLRSCRRESVNRLFLAGEQRIKLGASHQHSQVSIMAYLLVNAWLAKRIASVLEG